MKGDCLKARCATWNFSALQFSMGQKFVYEMEDHPKIKTTIMLRITAQHLRSRLLRAPQKWPAGVSYFSITILQSSICASATHY
jgi:hypothetical protein